MRLVNIKAAWLRNRRSGAGEERRPNRRRGKECTGELNMPK